MKTTKHCNRCDATLPIDMFRRKAKTHIKKDGTESIYYNAYCKPCESRLSDNRDAKLQTEEPIKFRWKRVHKSHKQRNSPTTVTLKHMQSLWTGKCAITGQDIDLNLPYANPKSAQLDRIIPDDGYVDGNVQWVNARMNRIKSNGTLEDFEQIIAYLKQHQCKRPR